MKLLYSLIFFFCFQFCVQSQTLLDQKKDSVLYYLKHAQDSLEFSFLKRAIFLSEEIEEDSLVRVSKIKFAAAGHFRGDSVEKSKSMNMLQDFYDRKKDSFALAKILHIKAMSFKNKIELDSSFFYYYQSKMISLLINDSIQVGRRLLSMGVMQKNENDLVGAEASLIEGLIYLEPLEEFRFTASTYNNLGLTLIRFRRYEEARVSFEKALYLHKRNDHLNSKERGFLDYYNNIGFSYIKEGNYEKAISILNQGLSYKTQINHLQAYQALLGNLADCLFEIGKREVAWSKTLELLKLREETNDYFGLSLSHNGIAYFYKEEGKTSELLYHAKKAYDFANKVNNNATKLSALLKLGEFSAGNKAKEYYKEYTVLNDSLNKRERYFKNQFAKVRYETEKKEKRNQALTIENSKNQADLESERLQKIIFALIGVLALVISVTYFRNRRKKLVYEAQLEKASAREEERQQIAKSLHDEVAGDLRLLHQKLVKTQQNEEAKSIEIIKDNVRNLSHQLSSESFDEVSFKDQMINLISDSFSPKFRISTEGIDTILWETINNTIKRTLYLCIRESLQNTIKYAEATKFFIRFSSEKKEILLLLEDNGKGIEERKGKKGIGLKNLKERVEEIHGSFHIESTEQGTKTTISIPINGR